MTSGECRTRGMAGVAALAITALAAGSALAVPVQPTGSVTFDQSSVQSAVTGHAGGTVDFLGHDAYWLNDRFHGGGGIFTSAWATYYFIGANAVAVGTQTWQFGFNAVGTPLDLYMDWDLQILAGSSAILGAAGGGGLLEVSVYQNFPSFPFPFPHLVGHMKEVYTDSVVDGDLTLLTHLDPDQDWFVNIKFETGSAAETLAVVGVAAAAETFAFLGFELWADDGTSPPVPVAEPGALALLAGTLPLLGLAGRRRRASA